MTISKSVVDCILIDSGDMAEIPLELESVGTLKISGYAALNLDGYMKARLVRSISRLMSRCMASSVRLVRK